MQYGLCFPNGGPHNDARSLGEFARLAEEAGWEGVFLEDYIVWQGHPDVATYDPWVALAAIALNTRRVRIGTMVTPLSRRRPWKVARETVTIDHLSNGRLILGVGLGDATWDKVTFQGMGEVTAVKARAKRLDEALDILVGLWSGEAFSYEGEDFQIKSTTFLPRPVQTPRIPIWVGGEYPNPGPLRRAARYEGTCLYKKDNADMTPADVSEIKSYVERHRAATSPYDYALGGRSRGDDVGKERDLIRSLAAAGTTWWIEYVAPEVGGREEICAYIKQGPLRIE